jgi:hypothetical protein
MSLVDNVPYTLNRGMKMGDVSIGGAENGTAGKGQPFSVTYDSAGAKTLPLTFDHTKLLGIAIGCDQALTSISFTGTTGPLVTPAIPAGSVWQWSAADKADPFGANCTAIVVTIAALPAGVTTATIKAIVAESV